MKRGQNMTKILKFIYATLVLFLFLVATKANDGMYFFILFKFPSFFHSSHTISYNHFIITLFYYLFSL